MFSRLLLALVLVACNQAPPPDRHVLWTGTGVPMTGAQIVSTHDSKAACLGARDAYAATLRPEGHSIGQPDKAGAVWIVRGQVPHSVVCYPVGVNPG